MTYDQIKNIQLNELIVQVQTDWMRLAKECLGIVVSSTMKDKEIYMLIESAIADLERVDIEVRNKMDDNLIVNTVMLYVKGHFGDTDINKKREYIKRYKENMRALKESEEYRKVEVESNV